MGLVYQSVGTGTASSRESYLNIPAIISAAEIADVEAVHPGYGFLAENAHFAEICESCKITFIGPSPQTIRLMGDKVGKRLCIETADELVALIKSVTNKLGYKKSHSFDLVMVGGVIQNNPLVLRRFKKEVKKLFPKVKFIMPKVKPVIGAIRLGASSL